MAAISGLIAIMLFLMIVLYKSLAPPPRKDDIYHVTVELDKMDPDDLDNKLSESTEV